jgi:hypothetical protein
MLLEQEATKSGSIVGIKSNSRQFCGGMAECRRAYGNLALISNPLNNMATTEKLTWFK